MEQVYQSYTRLLRMDKSFIPATAEARVTIAEACLDAGNAKLAARILVALHKDHPDYPELPQAFLLLARAFDAMPDMDAKARQCRKLAKHFEANPHQPPQNEAGTEAEAATTTETAKPISRFMLEEDNEQDNSPA